jgi:hypothetical protein
MAVGSIAGVNDTRVFDFSRGHSLAMAARKRIVAFVISTAELSMEWVIARAWLS